MAKTIKLASKRLKTLKEQAVMAETKDERKFNSTPAPSTTAAPSNKSGPIWTNTDTKMETNTGTNTGTNTETNMETNTVQYNDVVPKFPPPHKNLICWGRGI